MIGERIQLYAQNASAYSLLQWNAPGHDKSDVLAIPDIEARRRVKIPETGPGSTPAVGQAMEREGGVWTHVEKSGDQLLLTTNGFSTKAYIPPGRLAVVSQNNTVDYRSIQGKVNVRAGECVLLPVDAVSERQLESWLEGLSGLSADLRGVMLRSVVSGRALDLRAQSATALDATQPITIRRKTPPVPLWALLGALLAFVIGGAAGYFIPSLLQAGRKTRDAVVTKPTADAAKSPTDSAKPQTDVTKSPADVAKSQTDLAKPRADVAKSLADLEAGIKDSGIGQLNKLLDTHVGALKPLGVKEGDPARREIEAWMVVKLVMLKQPKSKVDVSWSAASNAAAAEFAKKNSQEKPIRAVFCYAGLNPPADCAEKDWSAQNGFADLMNSLKEEFKNPPPVKPAKTPGGDGQ